MRIMTHEMQRFVEKRAGGLSNSALTELLNTHFGTSLTISQVRVYKKNHHISSGLDGRFKKGRIPPNKGIKGVCAAGCEKGWFQKGELPHNHKPVGSERIDNKDGYLLVKTKEPNIWKLKHRIIWEQYYGPVPSGMIVIFLDGDKLNIDINNLGLIDKKTNVRMNQLGLRYPDAESTKTAIRVAELVSKIAEVKMR